ncbi:hypothetical protein ANTQUA_LOCUS5296 [Anthophora quadrimaculata]
MKIFGRARGGPKQVPGIRVRSASSMCSVNGHLSSGTSSVLTALHQAIAGKEIALEQIHTVAIKMVALFLLILLG